MNLALWIAQSVLALALAFGGSPKLFGGKAKMIENPKMGWAADFPDSTIRFIGLAEIAAAVGFVVAPLLDVFLWSPVAAGIGVVALMAGAAMVHARRKENQAIVANLVFIAVALFVVIGRIISPLNP
ncbi:MAG: hypothetical protein RL745_259 [Actinomycetota bacterium]|jgi:hypothetical protein